MSEAKSGVAALAAVADRLVGRARALPDEPASSGLVRELGANSAPKAPPGDVLEEIRQRLVAASRRGELNAVQPKDRRYAPWLLWSGKPAAAELAGLLTLVLDEARVSRPMLRRLIQAFLRDFRRDAPGISEAAACIRRQLGTADPRLDQWRAAQSETSLFNPDKGPMSLAARLLAEPDPTAVLGRCGFGDPMLADGGYMLAVEDAVRRAAPTFMCDHGTTALQRIPKIVAPVENRLRFTHRRAETVRALLGAWLTSRGEPAPALQEPVRRLLLGWLGDPRLPVNKQKWDEVGKLEAALVRRWLASASLDLFFALIDEDALDSQWRYRHAFWAAYLREGAISDAWLAFGPRSFRSAKAVPDLGQAYARLRGGSDAKQSALLMKIGALVVGEFSHNGKLRAWPEDWPTAPTMGAHEYERADLSGKCLPFPPNPWTGGGGNLSGDGLSHFGSDRGYWQGSAALLIERRTGIRITPQQWRSR